ncbi:MAG: hypothetical protein ACKOPO_07400 [Novosphingobium sp.]
MAMVAGRKKIVIFVLLCVSGLLAWAWIDGGERKVRTMTQDVSVPETAK